MNKITPCLWFDTNCEEALNLYTSLFENSTVHTIERYPEGDQVGPVSGMEGKILTAIFELMGVKFMALDGGPAFQKTPAISFTVHCKDEAEIDRLWSGLSEGGNVLMPLQKWPFAEKYGWVNDRFGTSWQLSIAESEQKIVPSLLFVRNVNGKAKEALQFYTTVFPDSKIEMEVPYEEGEGDTPGHLKFSLSTIAGSKIIAMDSGLDHQFSFTEAVSLYVECEDQEEVDTYWEKLSSDPAAEQCGWVKDKYGVSWQIIPKRLGKLLSQPDKEKANRVMQAMLQMKKIVVADLEKASQGA